MRTRIKIKAVHRVDKAVGRKTIHNLSTAFIAANGKTGLIPSSLSFFRPGYQPLCITLSPFDSRRFSTIALRSPSDRTAIKIDNFFWTTAGKFYTAAERIVPNFRSPDFEKVFIRFRPGYEHVFITFSTIFRAIVR